MAVSCPICFKNGSWLNVKSKNKNGNENRQYMKCLAVEENGLQCVGFKWNPNTPKVVTPAVKKEEAHYCSRKPLEIGPR